MGSGKVYCSHSRKLRGVAEEVFRHHLRQITEFIGKEKAISYSLRQNLILRINSSLNVYVLLSCPNRRSNAVYNAVKVDM